MFINDIFLSLTHWLEIQLVHVNLVHGVLIADATDSMSKLGSTNIDVSDSGKLGLGSTSPVCSSCAPVINPNEIMTSRAITFRDPETGAIYVQTQLLQVLKQLLLEM